MSQLSPIQAALFTPPTDLARGGLVREAPGWC